MKLLPIFRREHATSNSVKVTLTASGVHVDPQGSRAGHSGCCRQCRSTSKHLREDSMNYLSRA